MEDFEEFRVQVSSELDLSGDRIQPSTEMSELGVDSLAMAELLALLAERGVVLPQEMVSELRTFGDVFRAWTNNAARRA